MGYDHEKREITTERLVLRLFQPSDAEAVTALCDNYNIYKNTLYLPYPYRLNDALTWIDKHYDNFMEDRLYEFAVTDKGTGEIFGAIALSNNKAFNHGEIAYWIGEPYWGNGYATEAAKSILQFAFDDKKLHKVFARCFPSNLASASVIEKIGMRKEGTLNDHVIKDGKYVDLIYYGMINENG